MLNSGGHFTFRKRIATIVTGNVGALGAGGAVNTTTQFRTVGSVKLSTAAYSHPYYAVNAGVVNRQDWLGYHRLALVLMRSQSQDFS